VRSIVIAIGISIVCAIAPLSAKAETDRSTSKCEQKCHADRCIADPNPMYCHWACHEKCSQASPSK
jgi:hypothetical protein